MMMSSKTELAVLRKESLDIYNRIHSIAEDIIFVHQICKIYPDYPIIRMLSVFRIHQISLISFEF
jgi:hypothetical protein